MAAPDCLLPIRCYRSVCRPAICAVNFRLHDTSEFQAFFQVLTASPDNRIGFDMGKLTESADLGELFGGLYHLGQIPNNSSTTITAASGAASAMTRASDTLWSVIAVPPATGGIGRVGAAARCCIRWCGSHVPDGIVSRRGSEHKNSRHKFDCRRSRILKLLVVYLMYKHDNYSYSFYGIFST